MGDIFEYLNFLGDDFLFLLGVDFELLVGLNHTRHSIDFPISVSNFSKSSFTNDLIEDVILLLDYFRIFNRWKFKVVMMLGMGFGLDGVILRFGGSVGF